VEHGVRLDELRRRAAACVLREAESKEDQRKNIPDGGGLFVSCAATKASAALVACNMNLSLRETL
jgi:hypothetical protein